MQDSILRLKAAVETTGISRSAIYDKLNPRSKYYDPNFPRPLKLGARSVGFRSSELETWKNSLGKAA